MTKFLIGISLLFSFACFAQVNVAAKANLLFPTENATWTSIKKSASEAYETSGTSKVGYNFGLSLEIDLVDNLSIMPEVYYTSFQNEFTDSFSNTTIKAVSNRVDLPVLLTYNVVSTADIFAGPIASYYLSNDNKYNDFVENAKNEFTVGYQVGVQFKLDKLIFTGRYEGAVAEDKRDFINTTTGQVIRYDDRPNLFIAGIGYQF